MPARLSKREKQLLDLIYTDEQAKNFYINLGLSPKTVKLYLSRLFQKMHAANGRIELMARKIKELSIKL